jgi:hypothetical protein
MTDTSQRFRLATTISCSAASHEKEGLIVPGLAIFLERPERVAKLPSVDTEVESFIDPFGKMFLVYQSAEPVCLETSR